MPRKDQPQQADDEPNTGRRRSGRVSKPALKVVEWREHQLEVQQAADSAKASASARAEKRPHDYSGEELEELIAKRRKERDLENDAEDERQGPAPAQTQSGVNLDFVNRVRNTHADARQVPKPVESDALHIVGTPITPLPSAPQPLSNAAQATVSTPSCTATSLPIHANSVVHNPVRSSVPGSNTPTHRLLASTPTPGGARRVSGTPADLNGAQTTVPLRRQVLQSNPQHLSYGVLYSPHAPQDDLPMDVGMNPFVANLGHTPEQQAPERAPHQAASSPSRHPFLDDDFLPEQATMVLDTPTFAVRAPAAPPTPATATSALNSPTPTTARKLSLDPNNDPTSPTYGDGDGIPLPPRRVSTRALPDNLKVMDKKERKQARNRMRAKASDFAETENKILQAATTRFIALSICQDPLPTTERENALSELCWSWAAGSLHKRITHDKDLLYLLKRNLVNHRTGVSSAANEIVASHYKFRIKTSASKNTDASVESFNSDLAAELLFGDSFAFGDYQTREEPFRNELISFLFLKLWFQDGRLAGVQHPDVFFPVQITTIAYIVTLLEKSIKEWKPGSRKTISFSSDSHRGRLEYFEGQIKKFSNHPLVKEERIFEDYILELERSARKKIKQFATVKIEDDTYSDDESPGGGLNDADIERLLRKRKQVKAATEDTTVAHSVGGEGLPPSANREAHIDEVGGVGGMVGTGMVDAGGSNSLGLNIGFAAPYEASEPWGSPMTYFNTTQSTASTIYPEDSVSQQIPANEANFAAQSAGYLDQMNAPFM